MNDETPGPTVSEPPAGLKLEGDAGAWEANLNMREWVRAALVAKGAKFTGGGFGGGCSDLDIELEGFEYNITIRPRLKAR